MAELDILKFQTRNKNWYVLDGLTGTVLAIDDLILDSIVEISSGKSMQEIRSFLYYKYKNTYNVNSALAFLNSFITNKGAFLNNNNKYYQNMRGTEEKLDTELINEIFNAGHIQQLILNVTEDCNLRCQYCYLSEGYHYTRNRTESKMTVATAITALDKFFMRLEKIKQFNPGKKCGITFYGGEPLLNFQTIYASIEYSKLNCPVTPIFNITTNGTLLKDEILDYLIVNNVHISISLDGAKKNHDRNRLFTENNGSFNIVRNNIMKLKNAYPDYQNVNISSVFDYKTDLRENCSFFVENQMPPMGFITQVSILNTDYYKKFSKNDIENFAKDYYGLMNEYIDNKIKGETISPYLQMLYEIRLISSLFRLRRSDNKLPIMPYTSACIPGMKVSVRVDGTYDMCEKINETFPIGDNEVGYDYGKILNILMEYRTHVTEKCHECPLRRQCGMCFALCCKNGKFDKPNCSDIINAYLQNLSIIFSVLEENPHAYDNFKLVDQWAFNF